MAGTDPNDSVDAKINGLDAAAQGVAKSGPAKEMSRQVCSWRLGYSGSGSDPEHNAIRFESKPCFRKRYRFVREKPMCEPAETLSTPIPSQAALPQFERILNSVLDRRGLGDREKNPVAVENVEHALGRLLAIADYVRARGGRPMAEETALARKLIFAICDQVISPRKLGISLRQLGLNPKAQANPVFQQQPSAADWAHT